MSLKDILRDVLAETDLTDPHDITGSIMARIPDEETEEHLLEALTVWVNVRLSSTRHGVPDELIGRTTGGPTLVRESSDKPSRVQNLSRAKSAMYRSWWARFVDERVKVADEWKLMGDCTLEDVNALAESRREVAARNAAHAARYEALAHLMESSGATQVRELDPNMVQFAAA